MNVILWIAAALLAVAFVMAGLMKVRTPKEALVEKGMGWAQSFSPGAIRTIGALEILGAIGLIVPPLVGIAPVLAPLAALGLAVTMVGAIAIHARRGETQSIVVNVVLLAVAAFVAWGRFGPHAF